jgi:hypothetical protein
MFQMAQRPRRDLRIIILEQSAGIDVGAEWKVAMNKYTNRWTVSLGWMVAMLIVWSLFVPGSVSVTTFFLLGALGLIVTVFGGTFLKDRQPPQSVGAIIADLEAPPGTDGASSRTR